MYRKPFQLCHCMNVFPGTELKDKMEAFTNQLPKLRARISGATMEPFACGIWIDANSASQLLKTKKIADFADFVRSLGFYAFTANAFPYGAFHNTRVKTSVYKPDWTEKDRAEYTMAVADILSPLIPHEGINGSISTLPGAYKAHFNRKKEADMVRNIRETAEHLRRLRDRTGKTIRLAFEMEPDCLWESPEEFAAFYHDYFRDDELSEFIGVCYDTCHQELLGAKPGSGLDFLRNEGIRIPKIQLSAAIEAPDCFSKNTLENCFQDPVYLHQTRIISNGIEQKWDDLPDALKSGDRDAPWTLHFHIPVFTEELPGGLIPVKTELCTVLDKLRKEPEICTELEIETYSYHALPDEVKRASLEESMGLEMQWVLQQLNLE